MVGDPHDRLNPHFYPDSIAAFDPIQVFETLYADICREACNHATFNFQGSDYYFLLPSKLSSLLKEELKEQFPQYVKLGASEAHRRLLYRYHHALSKLVLDDTCLSCCSRRPEFGLPCKHSICHSCVLIFGETSPRDPNRYHLETCLACGNSTKGFCFRSKPPTAAPRVLSLDGGGIRGMASLKFLQVLEHAIDLPYPVQRHFDVVYGTSSGSIIVSGLCVNGWSIEECIRSFKSLSLSAFKPRLLSQLPLAKFGSLASIWQIGLSLLFDSKYESGNLEAALQNVFGSTKSLTDWSAATEMGIMVGITMATADGKTLVASNRNIKGFDTLDRGMYTPITAFRRANQAV